MNKLLTVDDFEVRQHKYNAKRTEYAGEIYDSRAEADYAASLDQAKRAGVIRDWWRQVPFNLHVAGKKIGKYIADFKVLTGSGRVEYVDVKGHETPLFRWKRKHLEAEYGFNLVIVKRGNVRIPE